MESVDFGPKPSPARQRRVVALAAAGLAVVVAAVAISQTVGSTPPVPSPSSPALPTRSPALPTPGATSPTTPTPAPVQVRRLEGFLAGTDLDLFVRGSRSLYRIQTRTQRLTITPLSGESSSTGSITFIVEPGVVLARDWDRTSDAGFLVRDGRAAEPLPEGLRSPDQVMAGPPGRVWVSSVEGEQQVVRLTDLRGRPVTASAGPSVYRGLEGLIPDGEGGLWFSSLGGSYAMTPDGPRRITRGGIVGTGRNDVLITDCSARLSCHFYLLDRVSGRQRRVGPARPGFGAQSAVSDQGRYVASWSWNSTGESMLRIVELRTGRTLVRMPDPYGSADVQSLVWLPDERLLTVREGRLVILDPRTGRISTPDLDLDNLQQLALRLPR